MIADKSWEILELCLVLNQLCNLLPHKATHRGMPSSRDQASSEALLLLPGWRSTFAILGTYCVTVFYSHSLLMKCAHIHMQVILLTMHW